MLILLTANLILDVLDFSNTNELLTYTRKGQSIS